MQEYEFWIKSLLKSYIIRLSCSSHQEALGALAVTMQQSIPTVSLFIIHQIDACLYSDVWPLGGFPAVLLQHVSAESRATMLVTWGRDSTVLAVLAGHFWCSEAASWASNMRLFWNLTWFQLWVHGPALVDVRRFHHVAVHVYLRMHKRSLTGKHHPELSSYSWFCLKNWKKKTRWKQNEGFASLHHHALCASSEGSFEMRSWWHLAMTGFIQYKITALWMFKQ